MWASYGRGRYAVGEADVIVRPSVYAPPKPAVLHIHGVEAGNGAADWMNVPSRNHIFDGITDAGYTIVSCDLGGSATWGNSVSQARIQDAYTYSQTLSGVADGPAILLGQSMGGLNALIFAKNNSSLVRSAVLLIPVCNLADLAMSQFEAAITASIGATYSEAAHGAQLNPVTFGAALNGIPMQLWYGTTDTLCKPQDALALAALAPSIQLMPLAGGHAESTVASIDAASIVQFMDS